MRATIVSDASGRIVGMHIPRETPAPTGNGPTHVELVGAPGRSVHTVDIPQHLRTEEAVRAIPRTHRLVVKGESAELVTI